MWLFNRQESKDLSHQAIAEAQESLRKANARTPEVSRIAQELKTLREQNHFAEKLHRIMEGETDE